MDGLVVKASDGVNVGNVDLWITSGCRQSKQTGFIKYIDQQKTLHVNLKINYLDSSVVVGCQDAVGPRAIFM